MLVSFFFGWGEISVVGVGEGVILGEEDLHLGDAGLKNGVGGDSTLDCEIKGDFFWIPRWDPFWEEEEEEPTCIQDAVGG